MQNSAEIQSKLADSERTRVELADRVAKLVSESESISSQLEQAELKASTAVKSAATLESQLSELQVRNLLSWKMIVFSPSRFVNRFPVLIVGFLRGRNQTQIDI